MERWSASLASVYLVVDVSWSMSTDGKLDAVNRMIRSVVDGLARERSAARRVRVAMLDFSDDARLRMPLSDPAGPGVDVPRLRVRNGTSFSSAFTTLRWQLDADAARLPPGYRLLPPTVFFISDGGPTDDEAAWRTAFAALVAHPSAPALVPCGVDEAEAHVMGSLIHPLTGPDRTALFMMARNGRPAAAITSVGELVVSSLAGSGGADGRPILPTGAAVPPGLLRMEPEQFA